MSGFIYIMSNPSFSDGRIKIGKSKADPDTYRKDELDSTGVPEPFFVEYFAFVEDHHSLERQVHSKLDSQRPNKNREFFTVSIPEAINSIRELAGDNIKYEEVNYKSPEEIKAEEERILKEREDQERIERKEEENKQKMKDLQKREKIRKESMNTYSHVMPTMQEEAARKIDEVFKNAEK